MNKIHYIRHFFVLSLIIVLGSETDVRSQPGNHKDEGYVALGPRKVFSAKALMAEYTLQAFTQEGVFVTNQTGSPWYRASLFAHGSVLKNADGTVLKEVIFLEATAPGGEMSWSVLWKPYGEQGKGQVEIIQGIGKWAGIRGTGDVKAAASPRADEFNMQDYSIEWAVDPNNPPFSDEITDKENYTNKDECLSFHGPHVFISKRDLANGISLEFSTQSGVLMSRLSPDTFSPRNNATCFDRGTTVKQDGKTLGDIMILEDTDADGDIAWLYHIWWYNKGPGIYRFIGGTGKWEGINGTGVTRGMYKQRKDDHFMLKSELYWNLPEK